MSNKKLFIIIGFLAALLVLETGYLIGKHTSGTNESVHDARNSKQGNKYHTGKTYSNPVKTPLLEEPSQQAWDPFAEMQRMQRVMNRLFNDSFYQASMTDVFDDRSFLGASFDPDIDVQETGASYVVVVDLPGVDKDSIDINVSPNSITVSGKRSIEREEEDLGRGFYRAERSFGSFSRTIPFSRTINTEEVSAETAEGVLIVKLPKIKEGYEDDEKIKVEVD